MENIQIEQYWEWTDILILKCWFDHEINSQQSELNVDSSIKFLVWGLNPNIGGIDSWLLIRISPRISWRPMVLVLDYFGLRVKEDYRYNSC